MAYGTCCYGISWTVMLLLYAYGRWHSLLWHIMNCAVASVCLWPLALSAMTYHELVLLLLYAVPL